MVNPRVNHRVMPRAEKWHSRVNLRVKNVVY